MAYRLSSILSGLSSTQQYAIGYLSGLDVSGNEIGDSFGSLLTEPTATTAAVYSGTGSAHKWANTAAGVVGTAESISGTAGGIVTFGFDPGSTWSAGDKNSFRSALALWSDIANISFQEVTISASQPASGVNEMFYTYQSVNYPTNIFGPQGNGAYHAYTAIGTPGAVGSNVTATNTQGVVSINTSQFTGTGDINASGGYGVSTLVHELGHAMGLGHGGPYNGTVNPAYQQLNQYDNYNYSIMSYINPATTTAQYYNLYNPIGTNYNNLSLAPTTAQINDILAAQELYGAQTGGALNLTQTFGFNCTISDAASLFFDFTKNRIPNVTLYDTAANNKLDLSGFSTAAIVNLGAGTFSSIAGMVNNLAIAFGTAIDRYVGTSGNNTITVNANTDVIDGGAGVGTNTVVFQNAYSAYGVAYTGGTITVTLTATGITDTLTHVQALKFTDRTVQACFLRGSLIATPRGEVAIEDLSVGEMIVTESGRVCPIVWIGFGRNVVTPRTRCDVTPVIVRAGALDRNVPHRDLHLTRRHGLRVGNVLVPVEHLINGMSIRWDDAPQVVDYYHIELDAHDILVANGAPAESYREDGAAYSFQDAGDWPTRLHEAPCLPVIEAGPALEQAWRSVAERAGQVPLCIDEADADLHLLVDNVRIDGHLGRDGSWIFALPTGARIIVIVSNTVIPAIRAGAEDKRRLGVAVREISLWRAKAGRSLRLDSPALNDGWHMVADGHRWTKGQAQLPAEVSQWFGGPTRLELRLVETDLRYRRSVIERQRSAVAV